MQCLKNKENEYNYRKSIGKSTSSRWKYKHANAFIFSRNEKSDFKLKKYPRNISNIINVHAGFNLCVLSNNPWIYAYINGLTYIHAFIC